MTNFLSSHTDLTTWGTGNCSIAGNAVDDPNAVHDAATITDTSSNTNHYASVVVSNQFGSDNYVFLVYFKYSNHQYVELNLDNGAGNGITASFDLLDGNFLGTHTNGVAVSTGGFISSVSNGWFLCGVSGSLAATDATIRCSIVMSNSDAIGWYPAYAGTGSIIEAWNPSLSILSGMEAFLGGSVSLPGNDLSGTVRVDAASEVTIAL